MNTPSKNNSPRLVSPFYFSALIFSLLLGGAVYVFKSVGGNSDGLVAGINNLGTPSSSTNNYKMGVYSTGVMTPTPTPKPTAAKEAVLKYKLWSEFRFDPAKNCNATTCDVQFVGSIANIGTADIANIRLGDLMTGYNWYSSFTKPYVVSKSIDSPLTVNAKFTGCANPQSNSMEDHCSLINDVNKASTIPAGKTVDFMIKVRVTRSKYDVPITNLVTLNAINKATGYGFFTQEYSVQTSGMPGSFTIPKK